MAEQSIIYMDHAAATSLDPKVLLAMEPYVTDQFYNPSATYTPALKVRKAIGMARSKIAHHLGARASEIIFTAGGSEANNLAIQGVMRQFPNSNVVVSAVEHESIRAPATSFDCRQVTVKSDGRLDVDELSKQIDNQTVLVSVIYANNEIGTVEPIREIAKIIAAKRRRRTQQDLPLYFHTDACQAANYLDLHVARLGVDMLSVNGGKIYGPKQSGALFVKAGVRLMPLIEGGGQEQGLRAGTENVAAIIGLAVALDRAQSIRQVESRRLSSLQHDFIEQLQTKLPNIIVNGSLRLRLPNNVHITWPSRDNERLLIQLDEAGILAAAGSACSASNDIPSQVLRAIGLSDSEAQASLRFTMGRSTTAKMVRRTVAVLSRLA